jgi:hypothetical protein
MYVYEMMDPHTKSNRSRMSGARGGAAGASHDASLGQLVPADEIAEAPSLPVAVSRCAAAPSPSSWPTSLPPAAPATPISWPPTFEPSADLLEASRSARALLWELSDKKSRSEVPPPAPPPSRRRRESLDKIPRSTSQPPPPPPASVAPSLSLRIGPHAPGWVAPPPPRRKQFSTQP